MQNTFSVTNTAQKLKRIMKKEPAKMLEDLSGDSDKISEEILQYLEKLQHKKFTKALTLAIFAMNSLPTHKYRLSYEAMRNWTLRDILIALRIEQ